MKNISKIALLAGLAIAAASCTDGNDWDTDGSFAGSFRPTSLSCEQTAKGETTVKFTFGNIPGSTGYQIEVATDTFSVEEVSESSMTFNVAKSPATLDGFRVETKYYARVRSIGATGVSAWVGAKSFTTAATQVINEETIETTMTSIKIDWPANTVLDRLTVEKPAEGVNKALKAASDGMDLVKEIELTDKDKAAGSYVISGLQPATVYTVKLFNGENRVGLIVAATQSGGPTGDYNIVFSASSTMGEQLAEVAAQAAEDGNSEYSVTVVIPAGAEATIADKPAEDSADDYSVLTLPNGMSVTFYGERGNAMDKVTIYKNLAIDGRHSVVKFQNLTVSGTGYLVNQSGVCSVDSFIVEDCNVSDLPTSFFRTQGGSYSAANAVNALVLKNSVFTNCGKGYGFIHVDGTFVNNVDIDGCTFNGICTGGKGFFMMTKYVQPSESLIIRNSTFYNFCGNGQYFIDFKDKANGPDKFELTNVLFGKTADDVTNKNVRGTCDNADYATNCYRASDCYKVIKGSTVLDEASADIFTDPANGDFTLKAGVMFENCGDPRWY